MELSTNVNEILEYIGDDFVKCPYLYIDLIKYGLSNENVQVWIEKADDRNITAVILRYYNGSHIFSRELDFSPEGAADIFRSFMPAMICGMKETIDMVAPFMPSYEIEEGQVLELKNYTGKHNEDAFLASRDDYRGIAELLAEDEVMGKPYGFDLLYQQLLERYDEGFGRSWAKKDEEGVVANSATYAEIDNLAIVSGGIVRPDKRGLGEYSRQLGSLCKDLISEGKRVISFAYGGSAEGAHYSVGFEKVGDWSKLIRCE